MCIFAAKTWHAGVYPGRVGHHVREGHRDTANAHKKAAFPPSEESLRLHERRMITAPARAQKAGVRYCLIELISPTKSSR